jgi:5-formyltetrahydrofolate cyclo-ligase
MRHVPENSKAELRFSMFEELARMPEETKTTASAQARALLERQGLWGRARSILFFAPIQNELDVWPLLETALADGKIVALPRFLPETNRYTACQVRDLQGDVVAGHLKIREPQEGCELIPLNRLDLTLVPGVAFDVHGRRLGRGKGFYDRLLAVVSGKTCGVAFDQQIVREVPIEPHDIQLDCILTPTRWIEL